ncbi:benzoate-CoA ligase family protein [Streptomyces goshikiensis]|uniref:benzoate-CoA ligase family protein n=1 Tax=Streptomyces goshikiensis TaxID=1942 RepID=UPI0022F38B50|nr:benzoate-CoA ligase family protein [Streptomyces goshikiensis]WBY24897.1 benzoate-CoA ligase family protein [Streptomyces goshikiensis]
MQIDHRTPMGHTDVPENFNVAAHFLDGADGDRTALIGGDGRRTSYARLRGLANRVGHALRALGVRPQDRVLIAMSDGVEFVAAWYGAQKIGAVTAEVYSFLHAKEYRYYERYVAPRVVVADAGTVERLRAAGVRNLLVAGVPADALRAGEHHFDSLVAGQPDELDPAPTHRDAPAIWKFTTGSTGAPKACVLPARSPRLSFDWYARGVLDLRPDDVVLPVPKLFFGYSRDLAALFPFGVGAAGIIFPERSTVERVFELIAAHRPTVLVNVPTMMRAMVAHPLAREQDLSCLRLCTSAGEALPPDLHRAWLDTFGVEVADGLGSSETYHIFLSNRPGAARVGTLGQEVPGYRVKVVGEDGEELPDGETGVLEVTGATAALEYWQEPAKSAAAFPAPHTVRSGDLAVRDADGFFHYRGRKDDLLKVGGVWIAPAEIEDCLLTHPEVVDCAVVGVESEGLTKPRAYVVARSEVTGTQLTEFVRAGLSPHKYPREYRFVTELPRTAAGKVDRRALRAA